MDAVSDPTQTRGMWQSTPAFLSNMRNEDSAQMASQETYNQHSFLVACQKRACMKNIRIVNQNFEKIKNLRKYMGNIYKKKKIIKKKLNVTN